MRRVRGSEGGYPARDQDGRPEEVSDPQEDAVVPHGDKAREDHERQRDPEKEVDVGESGGQGHDGEQQEQGGQQDPEPVLVLAPR